MRSEGGLQWVFRFGNLLCFRSFRAFAGEALNWLSVSVNYLLYVSADYTRTYFLLLQKILIESHESILSEFLCFQGFSVAFFFCFLNTEVQNTLKHHFETWRTNRSLGPSRFRSSRSKDWSPRSRTESIRSDRISILRKIAVGFTCFTRKELFATSFDWIIYSL